MRERIVSEIRRIANDTGEAPGQNLFTKLSGIRRHEWLGKIWSKWGDALVEAGYEAKTLRVRTDADVVLKTVAECCLQLGKIPSEAELKLFIRNHDDLPSAGTVHNHFPRRALLVEALRDWAILPENHSYFAIADMLPAPVSTPVELPAHQNYGHVYLLRAGEYYKIGQSSDLEKRVKSINVALPDKATLEHAISTDDPPGIEAYWHRRFADRRMNGEWFKLSKADILAFKKRKFQ